MALSTSRLLTEQFYEWEQRGRGWHLAPFPVELEPPFHPFFGHYVPGPYIDDGMRPTLLSKIASLFRTSPGKPIIENHQPPNLEYYPFVEASSLRCYAIALPKGYKVPIDTIEHLLVMLSYCKSPLSFEIIATATIIQIQFICRERDSLHVQHQIKGFLPECSMQDKTEVIDHIIKDDTPTCIIDFGLEEEFMRPLEVCRTLEHDPFIALFNIFNNLKKDEQAAMQILFTGTINAWSQSIHTAVCDGNGDSFFLDGPEMPALANEKTLAPLYGVAVRVIGQSKTETGALSLADLMSNSLTFISKSKYNALTPLINEEYTLTKRLRDVLHRTSHRFGMLLNASELTTFVHFPSPSVVSEKLVRDTRRTKASPKESEGHSYQLGLNSHQGVEKIVSLSPEQRLRHMHIIGATGTGKSTLLLNLIRQDIRHGSGFAVLDPHGDLIDSIISLIPKSRIEDVIVIDPFDSEYPVSFNILKAHSDIEKEILSSDLVSLFRRFSTTWGDQMNSVFANAILAILESTQGGTLIDLRRFLIEKNFREEFLKTVADPEIIYYWQKEYPLLKSSSIGPILTRLDAFLRPKLIRNMVAQKESLDFEHIMSTKKIVLVKLSHGLIGAENSFLLGALIVSKIQQAAMARQALQKEARGNYFCYIDEFHHFITPSMATILSGARKYHLGLVLVHQDILQVSKIDAELINTLIANAGTRVCFRLGDSDAKKLQEGFSSFNAEDLQNLPTGEAIARINQADHDFSLTIFPPSVDTDQFNYTSQIITRSRAKYAKQIEEKAITNLQYEEPILIKPEVHHDKTQSKKDESFKTHIQQPKENLRVNSKPEKEAESKHRYLQTLIKKMSEARGYKATLEVPTRDGKGKVDVALEKAGKRIACEVCVTTDAKWELHNLQKCLSDGYDFVVVCCYEQKSLASITRKIYSALDVGEKMKVLVLKSEAFFEFLDTQEKQVPVETNIKGYRIKVNYSTLSSDEAIKKRETMSQALTASFKRP